MWVQEGEVLMFHVWIYALEEKNSVMCPSLSGQNILIWLWKVTLRQAWPQRSPAGADRPLKILPPRLFNIRWICCSFATSDLIEIPRCWQGSVFSFSRRKSSSSGEQFLSVFWRDAVPNTCMQWLFPTPYLVTLVVWICQTHWINHFIFL